MKKLKLFIQLLAIVFPLFACHRISNESIETDNNSYINDFELIQENSKNNTRIRITSPQAILNPINKNIDIIDSSLFILNSKGQNIKINSGKSSLNNYKNIISVYNNVNISMIKDKNSFIKTNSFYWDLNKSYINLNKPLIINFKSSKIISSDAIYNIDTGLLKINNNIFNRIVYNNEGDPIYQIKIKSDIGNWFKDDNSLEFTSANKQVETTINFLSIK